MHAVVAFVFYIFTKSYLCDFWLPQLKILQFYVYLNPNPILLIVGGFLHRENTAQRTTSTAGQPAGSTVVHGHSPPPGSSVPPVCQLKTVVHFHSPPPAPPFSQLETVIHGHSPPLETVAFGGFILPLLAVLQTSHCQESNRSLKMVVGACQSC